MRAYSCSRKEKHSLEATSIPIPLDELLALKSAMLRVLSRDDKTVRDARRLKGHFERVIAGTGNLDTIDTCLRKLPSQTRLLIEGTRQASLAEIRQFHLQSQSGQKRNAINRNDKIPPDNEG